MDIIKQLFDENCSILQLDLYGKKIDHQCVQALVDALKINNTLTTLYLGSNQIGHQMALALADALKINTL